ncbi:polysaccharide biosynthesis tyrosine autokinase [Aliiglaciecola sp. 2_MG-2023]|uniref:GumC family protein n=1 Tax=unclassified Aliiglaciecola TaxID=2593648 RepID=UPI0026E135A9|nr:MULTISPECIES: polysaccharide biosynthesis tyrosine autokinase [unclassified Aliiglaciecola]MDO6712867.1 polysaccharide biosynthesis tyrosine autokinase [Aliiglaciecola sp. 2_MG-2023]MDO6752897.1 polysaccharide biosynthesis tyrosine autokinase [Aliiglaciecola sp. 1_MG-2023]
MTSQQGLNPALTDENAAETLDLSQYWRTIKRAKWLIAAVMLVCLLIGGYIAATATPIYQASSKILANPQQPSAAPEEQYIASAMVFLFYETQYEIIRSRAIAETVVDKLGLVDSYKKQLLANKGKKASGLTATIAEIKQEIAALFGKNVTTAQAKVRSDNDIKVMLAAGIQGGINVSGGQQSQIINISYQSPDPQLATDIINTLGEAYIQFGLESRLGDVKNTEKWLSEQSSELKAQLTASENKLRDFRMQQGIVDTSMQQQDANSRLQSLNNQLIRAQTELSTAEELYAQVKNVPANSNAFYSLGPVLQNATASGLVKEEARLQSKVDELFERYKEKHPKMISARTELKSVRDSLSREIAKIVERIESDYRLASQQVNNIQRLLTNEKDEIQSLQGSNFTLTSLEREVENNRRIYESFINRLMETNIRGDFTASNVQVIDTATVPNSPIKPNVKLIVTLSAFMGVFLGVVLAFVKEALHNTYRTPDALEENLKIPALGITMALKKKDTHTIPEMEYAEDTRSVFAESINSIRTGLQFSNIDNPPKTLLVTSATGSEGKSTLAMNLAAAYSQIGKTLLLEVDLRKPSISKNLQIKSRIGLTDLLAGTVNFGDCIVNPTDNKQFNVMPCGTIPHNPIELLSSEKFAKALQSLKTHFDHIILDGPPTLPVSDACIVGTKVDGVIVAVRAEETKIKVSKEAVKRLQKLHANVVGAVLTVAEPQKMSYYGDHYYAGEYYGTVIQPENEKPTAT